jgi:hypothetical protein
VGRLPRLAIMTLFAALAGLTADGLRAATNLVINGDFSLGNTGFGSDYTFASFTPCGNTAENQYTVGTNPATWNCSVLVVSVGDHTTGTGNMLIANGSDTALRVWFTSAPIPVVPNTNYFFEAWILNWSTTSVGQFAAQLTFRANGVDLVTASAAGVGVWTPVSTMWNSGSNTTVSLELFDGTGTVQGNDFAVDDIFFGTDSSITPTGTPTVTPTNPQTNSPTNTPTITPTSTRTNTPGQVPAAIVPTLSFPMLALLGLALAAIGLLLNRR